MASLVSSWSSNIQSLPVEYMASVEKRPGLSPAPISNDIPVIDFGDALKCNRDGIVQQVMKASLDFGLFQVINHGVSKDLMIDAMNVGKEFFGMSSEENARFFDDSIKSGRKGPKLLTHPGIWRDTLLHDCYPLESSINSWPDKPTRYREIVGPYTSGVRKLGMRIVDIIYEGLGFHEMDKFEEEFDKFSCTFTIAHYPICPDPSSSLGSDRHFDPNTITLLQQDVYGLQLEKDGQWLGVKPLPDAFVVNIGCYLQVISNEKLKAAMHRVVTNSACSRTSLGIFLNYPSDATIQPAKSLISPSNPPLYRAFQNKDFLEFFLSSRPDFEAATEYIKLEN